MKVPSIKSAVNAVSKRIEIAKYERHEKELNRLVNIDHVKSPEAKKELYESRETLANYAKAKGVSFRFSSVPKNNEILVIAKDSRNYDGLLVNGDVNAVETVERPIKRILVGKDGLNYLAEGVESHEDNFIRRVYRTAERLTKILDKKQ